MSVRRSRILEQEVIGYSVIGRRAPGRRGTRWPGAL